MNPLPKLHDWVVSCFRRLAQCAIRHPRRVLVIAVLVILGAAPGLARLKLRTDGHALVSPAAPEVMYDQVIREKFGIEDNIVVLIRPDHTNGIFNPATLQLVRDLTTDFLKLPGLNPGQVMSLATEPSFRLQPNSLLHQKLLEPPLTTRAELDLFREDLRRIELYTGTLVAQDGKSTAILIGTPSGSDRTQLYQRVLDMVHTRQTPQEDITITGAPVAESLLGLHILEDLGVPEFLLGASTRSHQEKGEIPASFRDLRRLVARNIGLVPLAVLVMVFVFLVAFRNVTAALLPLPEVAATLLFVLGLMGWLGVPVYLTVAVMPVLLTAMCVTDEIHLFGRYFRLLREQPEANPVALLNRTMAELVAPIVSTSVTTAIGFAAFAFSPLPPVRAFGIFTSVGVLFAMLYSLTVIPAMLALINPNRLVSRRQRAESGAGGLAGAFARLALTVVQHRWWVVGFVLLITALTPLGLRRVEVQDSWIDGFDPDSEFRRATQLVNEQFYGMHLLLLTLEAPALLTGEVPASDVTSQEILLPGNLVADPALIAGSPITISPAEPSGSETAAPVAFAPWRSHLEMVSRRGDRIVARFPLGRSAEQLGPDWSRAGRVHFEIAAQTHVRPEIIQATGDLSAFVGQRRQDAVGGVLSPYDYILTTRFMARPNDPAARQLPGDPGEIKLIWDYYGLARGRHRLRQIVDTNYWQSVTTVFLKDANFVHTASLMSALRSYEREQLTPKGIKLGFAGDVAVSQSLIQGIVTTQVQSLFWSLAGIYLVTALLGGSLRRGLYCVLPSTLAVLINFAVMGWLGIPLGVATSMFAGMTLGIGVDFAIHVVEGYGLAGTGGATGTEALRRAMAGSGPAVLVNTGAIALGFGVMLLSQVPANARLGALLVLGMVNCLIASLLLLPVLLHWGPLIQNPKVEGNPNP